MLALAALMMPLYHLLILLCLPLTLPESMQTLLYMSSLLGWELEGLKTPSL